MQAAGAAELLEAWERGAPMGPAERGLALLSVAFPDTPSAALAELSIGRRDAILLGLRELTFGPRLAGLVPCPSCGSLLETSLTVAELRAGEAPEKAQELAFEAAGFELHLRLPNSHDLIALSATSPAEARRVLFERCLIAARSEGRPAAADELPEEAVK